MQLSELVAGPAARHAVPGGGVGVRHGDDIGTAFAGVTSIENPLPVDARTLFQIGSVTKTFTVTAVLRLVTDGRVDLDDPVREHVPELRLADPRVAAQVRVRHLLNHTAGWDGSMTSGGRHPQAPLADFVAGMAGLEQVSPLGRRAEYNNAALALAGRLIEKVTGEPYEAALRALLLEPLGLSGMRFTVDDLMTERCTVGHVADDGGPVVARPWRWPRAANPEGGLVATIDDVLGWAGFHLGDGCGPDGTRLVAAGLMQAMRTPTATLAGNAMGDAVGLGWFLRDVGGVTTLGHPGATNGQFAELCVVPDRRYAVIVCANGAPGGTQFTREVVDTALAQHLGLRRPPPVHRPYDATLDGDVAGSYANSLSRLDVEVSDGVVALRYHLQPAAAAEMGGETPDFAPCRLDFVDGGAGGPTGVYAVRDGAFAGLTGSFVRDDTGAVTELDFGGRWHRRR